MAKPKRISAKQLLKIISDDLLEEYETRPKSPTKLWVIRQGTDKEELLVQIQYMIERVNLLTMEEQLNGYKTRAVLYSFLNDRGITADGFSFEIE